MKCMTMVSFLKNDTLIFTSYPLLTEDYQNERLTTSLHHSQVLFGELEMADESC